MSTVYEAMVAFFREEDWRAIAMEGRPVLQLGFQGQNGQWTCFAKADDEQQQLMFYSVCPLTCPPERLGEMSELLHRANFGMLIGNFELDFNDGEIRYKTSIDVEGNGLTSSLCRSVVYINCQMMDRYLPAIMAVLVGSQRAVDAVAQVEGDLGAPPAPPAEDEYEN